MKFHISRSFVIGVDAKSVKHLVEVSFRKLRGKLISASEMSSAHYNRRRMLWSVCRPIKLQISPHAKVVFMGSSSER